MPFNLWRTAKIFGIAGLVLLGVLVLCISILAGRLAMGPISLPEAGGFLDSALVRSLGPGTHVTSGPAELAWTNRGFVVALDDAVIGAADKGELVSAAKAEITIDPRELLRGQLAVHGVSFVGPIVRLTIGKDGRVQLNPADQPVASYETEAAKPGETGSAVKPGDGAAVAPRHGLLAIVRELFEGSGPFAAMRNVEIRNGRLAVRDERTGEDVTLDDLNFSVVDDNGGHRFALAFSGPLGPSSVTGTLANAADIGRQIHLEPAFVPLGYFLLPFLPLREVVGMNSPVRGTLEATVDQADRITLVSGDLGLANLAFGGSDAVKPVVLADRLSAKFSFDPQDRVLRLSEGEFAFAKTQVLIAGTASAAEPGWKLDLTGNANLNSEMSGARIETDALSLRAHLPENLADFAIDDLVILGEGAKLEMTGHLGTRPDGGRGAQVQASAGPMNAQSLIALWPPNLSKALRERLKSQLVRGTVNRIDFDLDLSEQDIRDIAEGRGNPGGVSANLDLTDVAFRIDPKLPMIVTPAMSLHLTNEDANVIIPSASLGEPGPNAPTLNDWRVAIADLAGDDPQLKTNFRLNGQAGALPRLIAQTGLVPTSGTLEANVEANLPLADAETKLLDYLTAKGKVSDFTVADLGKGVGLDKADLQFEVNKGKLSLGGTGRMLGSAAKLALTSNLASGSGDAQASFTLDEAARAKLGLGSADVTGPIGVEVKARLSKTDLDTANVSLDFAKAAIASPIAGVAKAAGRPGRASFQIKSTSKGKALENINYSAPPVSFAGRAQLADGGLVQAALQKVSLAPGDSFDASIEKAGRGWKITVSGAALDARPFLAAVRGGRGSGSPDAQIEGRIGRLTGYAGERIRDADLRLQLGPRGVQQFGLDGGIGSGRITANFANQLTLQTSDVGATLRFLDLYRTMLGGQGSLRATLDGERFQGEASVAEFTLSGDPLLNKSAEIVRQSGKVPQGERVQADQRFTKLNLEFTGNGSKIDIRNAVLNGADVGITFNGWIDLASEKLSLAGTYVPAFGLNSMLTSIPIVGALLGGGQDGLLGITFRLDGSLSQPRVSVNPLSALAPGIFRQIFGYEPRRG
jgi:hypothetical protein